MKTPRAQAPTTPSDPPLDVQPCPAEDIAWFDQTLAQQHSLGAGCPVGDYLRQVVRHAGQAVALLVWGPSAALRALPERHERQHSHPARCLALLARAWT